MIAIPNYISAEEYLEIERYGPIRHEYRRGLVYAMAGGTNQHHLLALNLFSLISEHLEDSEHQCYSANATVKYQDEYYYHPDVFVTRDPRDHTDRYIKQYPQLIAEVLSSSTTNFDSGEKFDDYQKIQSLEEYVLIAQDRPQVECRRRTATKAWETREYQRGERVVLQSIGFEFAIADLYQGLYPPTILPWRNPQ